jgi:uncharacterized OB-fold protein
VSVAAPELYRTAGDGTAVLVASRCPSCGLVVFPKQAWCPRCVGVAADEAELGPAGTLVAFTGVHHATPGSKVPPPYAVGLVEFEGGVRVAGLMTVATIEGLRVGQAVAVVGAPAFEEDGEIRETYRFRP